MSGKGNKMLIYHLGRSECMAFPFFLFHCVIGWNADTWWGESGCWSL